MDIGWMDPWYFCSLNHTYKTPANFFFLSHFSSCIISYETEDFSTHYIHSQQRKEIRCQKIRSIKKVSCNNIMNIQYVHDSNNNYFWVFFFGFWFIIDSFFFYFFSCACCFYLFLYYVWTSVLILFSLFLTNFIVELFPYWYFYCTNFESVVFICCNV